MGNLNPQKAFRKTLSQRFLNPKPYTPQEAEHYTNIYRALPQDIIDDLWFYLFRALGNRDDVVLSVPESIWEEVDSMLPYFEGFSLWRWDMPLPEKFKQEVISYFLKTTDAKKFNPSEVLDASPLNYLAVLEYYTQDEENLVSRLESWLAAAWEYQGNKVGLLKDCMNIVHTHTGIVFPIWDLPTAKPTAEEALELIEHGAELFRTTPERNPHTKLRYHYYAKLGKQETYTKDMPLHWLHLATTSSLEDIEAALDEEVRISEGGALGNNTPLQFNQTLPKVLPVLLKKKKYRAIIEVLIFLGEEQGLSALVQHQASKEDFLELLQNQDLLCFDKPASQYGPEVLRHLPVGWISSGDRLSLVPSIANLAIAENLTVEEHYNLLQLLSSSQADATFGELVTLVKST